MNFPYNNSGQNNGGILNNQFQTPQQSNIQPLFPQPQGNVYNINSTLEVANVPVGAGISVALCLNEGLMYIKTMQNGNPLFWAYKIEPYDSTKEKQTQAQVQSQDEQIVSQIEQRFTNLEQQVSEIQNSLKKEKGEWKI